MRKIKGVIFDKDGVITDSEEYNYIIIKTAFKYWNIDVSFNEFLEECTKHKKSAFEVFKPKNVKIERKAYQELKKKLYFELFDEYFKLLPGAIECISKLSKDFKLGLATGNKKYRTDFELKKTGLDKYFLSVLSRDDVINNKPDPEVFLKSAHNLKLKPEECVVIEDAYGGIVAAKKANMYCIAIPNNYTKEHDFNLADKIIKSLSELDPKLIKSLTNNAK
jgi:beta-phosphoglucomutase